LGKENGDKHVNDKNNEIKTVYNDKDLTVVKARTRKPKTSTEKIYRSNDHDDDQ